MTKRIKVQIFEDGTVQAEVQGIKGKKCTNYIKILEDILQAETVDSDYTKEYYETEKVMLDEVEHQELKAGE
ncbi:DUF2997 domain-containing protein [Clostridium aciditolerans]|uniref:DUF2997 domain-containing protein n=1 Tax=Clostridium aciditolerans TaxID=339861 RepID=A0A934I4D4_9CLOT|nr:DUF2997 domain-containing protein [Clostridium aciditolerans]MBI6874766.1 DUF2997 domain-containing protein [Clostridium aciditolerans]